MHLFSPDPSHATDADFAECRAMLRNGSRTFLAASHLLPRRVRDPAICLYAFCRIADDAIDNAEDPVPALAWLHQRLALAYAGRPLAIAADRALADVVARFAIPRALPQALLDGFGWDAASRRYEDLTDLTAYAVRVAGTVGVMMAMLMGARTPEALARACDLGVAMQLSNVARDVGEDARAGRLYLPLKWLREAGIDPDAWLASPEPNAGIGMAVERLLRAADAMYERGSAGIARLPRSCRPGIRAAQLLYAEIGREVERQGCDSVTARAVVSGRQKMQVLAGGMLAAGGARSSLYAPPLEEARFVLDGVEAAPPPVLPPRPARRRLDERMVWVLDLFERLERRQQIGETGI